MVFGVGVMLIILSIFHAIGLGAKVKDDRCSTSDEGLAMVGKIITIILIAIAGICLLCV